MIWLTDYGMHSLKMMSLDLAPLVLLLWLALRVNLLEKDVRDVKSSLQCLGANASAGTPPNAENAELRRDAVGKALSEELVAFTTRSQASPIKS